MTAPRKPNNKADAIEISVPSIITKPVNVIITVAIANIINMMNGNANERKHIDMPNAKNGCRANCCTMLSSISYAPMSSKVRSTDFVECRPERN